MKPGDRVKIKKSWVSGHSDYQMATILEISKKSVKLAIDDVGGYFILAKDVILEVINESR